VGATVDSVLQAAQDYIKPWSGAEMLKLIGSALDIARTTADYKKFRQKYHETFRKAIACDSRETVPATLAIVWLAKGDPKQAAIFGANFGRDADTIACMAAGICGALSGVSPDSNALIELLPNDSRQAQIELAARLTGVTRLKANTEMQALRRHL
jgi:ADP-ribosylglycohydrolase